jgi:hypothetical protein
MLKDYRTRLVADDGRDAIQAGFVARKRLELVEPVIEDSEPAGDFLCRNSYSVARGLTVPVAIRKMEGRACICDGLQWIEIELDEELAVAKA